MLIFTLILFILGVICQTISRHYRKRIERMDLEYSGDIIPDAEAEGWYKYGRLINYRIMKATQYMGYLFFFYIIAFLFVTLLSLIL